MATAALDSTPKPEGWLFGRWTDLLIGCGLGYLAFIPILLGVDHSFGISEWPALMVMGMALFLNGPHYGATIVRVYEHASDRRKYSIFSVYITIALLIGLLVSSWNIWLASLLITAYLTWSPWHFSGQNYGLMLMFLRRRGVDVDTTTKRLLYSSFLFSAALAILTVHGGNEGTIFAPSTLPVANTPSFWRLPLPPGVAQALSLIALIGTVATTSLALFRLSRAAGPRVLFPALLIVATQALWFTVPAVIFKWTYAEGNTLIFAAIWVSSAHSIQYLWVTAHYARRSEEPSSVGSFLLKSFVAGTAIAVIPAILLAPQLFGRLPWDAGLAAAIFSAVNIHHFILDGAIWKLRDGRVARALLRTDEPALPEPITPEASSRSPLRTFVWTVAALAVVVALVRDYALNIVTSGGKPEEIATAVDILPWVGREMVEVHVALAQRLAIEGDRQGAIEHFERSIELHPTTRAWAALGVQYRAIGSWNAALDAFDSALAIDARHFGALHGRAQALIALSASRGEAELPADVVTSLERALELAPGYAPAAVTLAVVQEQAGSIDLAIRTLETALAQANARGAAAIEPHLEALRARR